MTKLTLLRHMQRIWSAERASELSAILKVSGVQQMMITVGFAILRIYRNRIPVVEITADNTSCVVFVMSLCLVREEEMWCSSYAAIRRDSEKHIQNISHETLGKERDFLEHLSMNERILLKRILQKSSANCELDFSASVLFNWRVTTITILLVP